MSAYIGFRNSLAWRNGAHVRHIDARKVMLDAPAVVLMDPKYPHNVAQIVRLCACYGIKHLVYSGLRVAEQLSVEGIRIPREERMRDYEDVNLINYDRPFEILRGQPVAIEYRENAENLPDFQHPADPIYVFGPEDGSLGRLTLQHCHRFVMLPTKHCLNLSMAVGTVLYDRCVKTGGQIST